MKQAASVHTAGSQGWRVLLLLPVLASLMLAMLQYWEAAPARLGDDWIYFHQFDHIPLWPSSANAENGVSALTMNGSAADGLRFRPFCYAWIWLERLCWQSYWPSWAMGIAWIAASGLALALWLLRLGVNSLRAALAGTLLVLHPAQAEVWGWASARVDTMACALGLAGLCLLASKHRLLAFLAFFAAFGSKESAYPLLIVAALVPLFRGLGARTAAKDGLAALLALVSIFGLKYALLGQVFATSWGQALQLIPWSTRLAGWSSFLTPLFAQPLSSAAQGRALDLASALWLALMLLAICLPVLFLLTGSRRQRLVIASQFRARAPIFVLCLIAALLCVSVSFGVEAREDLAGGRLWFLPSAFLFAAFSLLASRVVLATLILLGAVLLHGNLAPYRDASRKMAQVEARVEQEFAHPERALRISKLPSVEGPVPLFFLMTELWAYGREVQAIPRVFLSHSPHPDEDAQAYEQKLASLDKLWTRKMNERSLKILRLVYRDGELVEAQ